MVMKNKKLNLINKYRKLLNKKFNTVTSYEGSIKRGIRKKLKILNFYEKNGCWPSRLSKNKAEVSLATSFENFMTKSAGSYDQTFRRIAMVTGRKTNNKSKHDKKGFKNQIINFIKKNGHVPRRYADTNVIEEGNLRSKLDYYIDKKNDMTFLGKVYKEDKCHKSGIPMIYRPIINDQLELKKPLIRLAK